MINTQTKKQTDAEIKHIMKLRRNRERAIESMKQVLKHPSGTPQRWRAAYNHFLRQRPDAAVQARQIAEFNKERRLGTDKFGSMKIGRFTMSSPAWLLDMLRQTDPEYFLNLSHAEVLKVRHLRKLKAAFPEFFIPEVI